MSDLDTITYLRINKISIDDVLIVDSSDLQYFHNLQELSIENGYELDIIDKRYHHEIYLSDPRKCDVSKLKTVIRHPVKKVK